MNENKFEKLEEVIANLMQTSKIPSIAINVVKDNKVIYSKAIGARALKGNISATTDTLYGIGSITKSFTCIAIHQLAEKGKLNINDPIHKYLDFQLGMKEKPITIHHLMSHSSGISNLGVVEILIFRNSDIKETFVPLSSNEDFLLHVNNAKEEIISEPGKLFFYLNSGFILLGLIIEKVSGQKYEDYIKENILLPLEMKKSCFKKEDFDSAENKMTAYYIEKDKTQETIHPFDELIYAPGGLLSSVNEMKNYLIMNLNHGSFNGKQIISSKSLDEMLSPVIDSFPSSFGVMKYGYGWGIINDFFGEKLISHGGSTGVSSAHIAFLPAKNIGVIIAGNCGNSLGGLISQAILATLLCKNPFEDHPDLINDKKISKLVGEYQTYKGINKIEIIKKGSILFLKRLEEEGNEQPLIPATNKPDDFHFLIPLGVYNFPVEFLFEKEKGKITLLFERNAYHKK